MIVFPPLAIPFLYQSRVLRAGNKVPGQGIRIPLVLVAHAPLAFGANGDPLVNDIMVAYFTVIGDRCLFSAKPTHSMLPFSR